MVVTVIVFYAVLIGGLALAAATYLALLIAPALLVFRRFGVPPGIVYSGSMLGLLWATYEPPYGGRELSFVPVAMRPSLYIAGTFQEPPVAMLVAAATMSVAALVVLLAAWLFGRRART